MTQARTTDPPMKEIENVDKAKIEMVGDQSAGVCISGDHPRIGNVDSLTPPTVRVILECADFYVAVDAVARVELAWNGQLEPAVYKTEARAFVITVDAS